MWRHVAKVVYIKMHSLDSCMEERNDRKTGKTVYNIISFPATWRDGQEIVGSVRGASFSYKKKKAPSLV